MGGVPSALAEALLDRYVLERELGRGGMATVYLAEDLKHRRKVALKVLRPELAATLGSERFLREIEIAARLSHSHILPLHDSGEAGGFLFYVMPYVEGEPLRQRLDREGQLPVDEALGIVRAVASALTYAHHAGVIHRDIKPENILLSGSKASGGPVHPLVADFGIARAFDAAVGDRLTETGLALGTPTYMSPEQAAGGGRLDGRSDIYALGCVAYEMLAGAPPFSGPTVQAIMARHAVDPVPRLRTVRSTVPDAVESAIERALAKVPADRFPTADEFADALARKPLPRLLPRGVHAHRRMALALGCVAVLGAVGVATITRRGSGAPSVIRSASSIAVLPFRSAATDTMLTRLGRDLATTVSASLDGVGGIQTADRLTLARQTAERPPDSPEEEAALARSLGASSVLRGTMVRDGPRVRVDLGLYAVDGFAPLTQGITVTALSDSIAALTDSVVWGLLRQVWQRGEPPSPSLDAVTTRSVPALRAFLNGEREIETNRWDAAALAFRSAIAADSTFWLAYFRLALAQYWNGHEAEPYVTDVLHRHREVFPERERLLIDAWNTPDSSFPLQIERFRRVTQRFPDYWPGWFLLGDRLFHIGPLFGYTLKESEAAFQRAVALNPRLKPAWDHLWSIGVRNDYVESARTLTRLLALGLSNATGSQAAEDEVHLQRLLRLESALARSGGIITTDMSPLADTVARDWASLEATPSRRSMATWALLWFGFPVAQVDWNRRVLRSGPHLRYRSNLLRGIAWGWAERGAWDSALAVLHDAAKAEPAPLDQMPATALDEYGMAVLGVWLGAVNPEEAVSRRPSARTMILALGDSGRRIELLGELAWLDGVLAFSTRNRAGLERAREDGRRSGHPQADLIDRSLRALGRGLSGDRGVAGRELAALEWHNAGPPSYTLAVAPNVAIQRITAAAWLLEAGDTAQAVRLLTWYEAANPGWEWSFTYAVTPLAYLMLARIEEAQGDTRSATTHYEQFLRRYDAPMPGQRHLVEEARAALMRFAGRTDPTTTP